MACPVAPAVLLVVPVALAGAAKSSGASPCGNWRNAHAMVLAGKNKGGPYPNRTDITSCNLKTGAFSGWDDGYGNAMEKMGGTLHGYTMTATNTRGGVVLHDQGTPTLTFRGIQV